MRQPEVLIVGAGPTGLSLACSLLLQQVPCRLVEASAAPARHSRALAVHSRTLELLHPFGVTERLLAKGWRVFGFNAYSGGERVVHVGFDELESPYPFILSLPQSDTERALSERLEELGGRIERQVMLETLVVEEGGAVAALRHQDGLLETEHYRFVIGCDGAHSTVRHELNMEFTGSRYDEGFLLADVELETSLPRDEAHTFLTPDGVLAIIPLPPPLHRLIMDFPTATELPKETPEALAAVVAERGSARLVAVRNPVWISCFRIHRRIVPQYRLGNVFLAGDAAHIHSPVGGQGMNTGIQDACNLGWKLGLVCRGLAGDELLQSYELERRPIAHATLRGTDRATRVVTLRRPLLQSLRNHLASFLSHLETVQRRLVGTVSGIRLNYAGSPIVREHRPSLLSAHLTQSLDSEDPSVGTWLDFGAAPAAGDRAPDVPLGETRLFDLLPPLRHTLLLFDGAAPTPAGYHHLIHIAETIESSPLAPWIAVHIVVPAAERPPELALSRSVILDADSALHHRYGAGSEALYLIRPDGYIGFRSQPADLERLMEYLAVIFGRVSGLA